METNEELLFECQIKAGGRVHNGAGGEGDGGEGTGEKETGRNVFGETEENKRPVCEFRFASDRSYRPW